MKRLIMIGAALFALAACEDKKPETKPEDPAVKNATTTTTASVAATTTAATTAAAPMAINDSDISTPADFEETAEKAIDKKNYKAELSTLETDIAKD